MKIGRGRYAGTARVTDTAPSASATDSAIQQMLEAAVARKSLPAPTANTVYFAFLPPGVTVVAGSERSCQAFCGYHDRSAGGLYYAVVPYPNCSRSEEHTSELQSRPHLVCRLLLEKKNATVRGHRQ